MRQAEVHHYCDPPPRPHPGPAQASPNKLAQGEGSLMTSPTKKNGKKKFTSIEVPERAGLQGQVGRSGGH